MSSPFDLSAEIFTQQYAAVTGEEPSSGDAYDTACDVLKAWRNCNISTSEAKSKVRELVSDASAWNDTDWNDFWDFDCSHIPNNRTIDAEVSDWGEWSDCAPNWLGQGKQSRKRTIVKRKRTNCIDSLIQGVTLDEFRDCELSDDSGNGDSENGNGSGNGSGNGNGNGSSSDDTNEDAPDNQVIPEDETLQDYTINEEEDDLEGDEEGDDSITTSGTQYVATPENETSELTQKLMDNWVLVGVALVGLALLR